MTNKIAFKIGLSALVVPTAIVGFGLYRHFHLATTPDPKPAVPPVPHLTVRHLGIRSYKTAKGYSDVSIITDPQNTDQHCLYRDEKAHELNCYPNNRNVKIDTSREIDLAVYNAGDNHADIKEFEDPENPDFYCLGIAGAGFTCFRKPNPAPK